MSIQDLNLQKGKWLAANCGDLPSENNCKLVIMAPENQKEDLLTAAVDHAAEVHGHEKTPELRKESEKMLQEFEI
mgnify:CR=1 FL=1